MSTTKNPALRNAIERHARVCQHSKVARHILDADCCHEDNAFALFSLPRKLPGLFTVRFTAPADFTAGDIVTLKGREFTIKTRTMEEPSGKLFSAGAVVLCEIDMERNLAFVTMGGEVQIIGGNLGDALPEMDGTASAGSSTNVSREDHIHPTDTSRAPIDSPALTGEATAPTPTSFSLSTAIATKEYVDNNSGGSIPDFSQQTILADYTSAFFPRTLLAGNTPQFGEYITIPHDGLFVIQGYSTGLTLTRTTRREVAFFINDFLVARSNSADSTLFLLSERFIVSAGDIVRINVWYRDGGTISWNANTNAALYKFK